MNGARDPDAIKHRGRALLYNEIVLALNRKLSSKTLLDKR